MEAEEYREIYEDMERVILALSTASHLKKIGFKYYLTDSEMKEFDRFGYIYAAELRQGIEKIFDKYIDRDLQEKVQIEVEKRKRPRKPKDVMEDKKDIKQVSEGTIGKLKVKSFE